MVRASQCTHPAPYMPHERDTNEKKVNVYHPWYAPAGGQQQVVDVIVDGPYHQHIDLAARLVELEEYTYSLEAIVEEMYDVQQRQSLEIAALTARVALNEVRTNATFALLAEADSVHDERLRALEVALAITVERVERAELLLVEIDAENVRSDLYARETRAMLEELKIDIDVYQARIEAVVAAAVAANIDAYISAEFSAQFQQELIQIIAAETTTVAVGRSASPELRGSAPSEPSLAEIESAIAAFIAAALAPMADESPDMEASPGPDMEASPGPDDE